MEGKRITERKIYTAEDMIEFASWAGSNAAAGAYNIVVDAENLKNWLNERSRKEQYKDYLRKAMVDNDVCLSGFDEWFEKFWGHTPPPL